MDESGLFVPSLSLQVLGRSTKAYASILLAHAATNSGGMAPYPWAKLSPQIHWQAAAAAFSAPTRVQLKLFCALDGLNVTRQRPFGSSVNTSASVGMAALRKISVDCERAS